jgi:hypothetical protein
VNAAECFRLMILSWIQLWRRRYFQMSGRSLKLYKNDKEASKPPIDEVILSGNHVKTIDENAEDLMAIPHSFKLNFVDYDEEPYLFYCDEEVSQLITLTLHVRL